MAPSTVAQGSFAGNACPVPFTFQNHPIRTVMVEGQPWFVAKDVSRALGLIWCGRSLSQVPAEWSTMCNLHIDGRRRQVKVIAEPAVYKLAFRSNKPEADTFTNWVASEVLPAIRKSGQFTAPAALAGPLTPAQCRHLHDVLDAKVSTRPKESRRAIYAEAWTRFNRHFRIAKYDQLPQNKLPEALAYLIHLDLKAAQKALPPAEPPAQRLPSTPRAEDLARDVEACILEADRAADKLFHSIGHKAARQNLDRPATFAQLHYLKDELFHALSANLMAIRRLAVAARVAERELTTR